MKQPCQLKTCPYSLSVSVCVQDDDDDSSGVQEISKRILPMPIISEGYASTNYQGNSHKARLP